MNHWVKQSIFNFFILMVMYSITWLFYLGLPKTHHESKQAIIIDKDSITNKFGIHPYIVYQFADGTSDGKQVSLVEYSQQKIGDKITVNVSKHETTLEMICIVMFILFIFVDMIVTAVFISSVSDIF